MPVWYEFRLRIAGQFFARIIYADGSDQFAAAAAEQARKLQEQMAEQLKLHA